MFKLARQHPSDLLCSLTCEWDRWRTAQRRLYSTSSFAILSDQTFRMLYVRHTMLMHIPIPSYCGNHCLPPDRPSILPYTHSHFFPTLSPFALPPILLPSLPLLFLPPLSPPSSHLSLHPSPYLSPTLSFSLLLPPLPPLLVL